MAPSASKKTKKETMAIKKSTKARQIASKPTTAAKQRIQKRPAGKTKAEKPRTTRTLLSANKRLTASAKAMNTKNQTESLLFLLPPEVRNRIYGLVMGGRQIHQNHADTYMCFSDDSERAVAMRTIEAGTVSGNDILELADRHALCSRRAPTIHEQLGLNLLLVCRKVHAEAALLPFTTNTFVLSFPVDIVDLGKKLIPEQRKALTSIAMTSDLHSSLRYSPKLSDMADFSGLRDITILITPAYTGSPEQMEVMGDLMHFAAGIFKYAPFRTAVVCVEAEYSLTGYYGNGPYLNGDFKALSREVEQTLPLEWDLEAKLKLEKSVRVEKAAERKARRERERLEAEAERKARRDQQQLEAEAEREAVAVRSNAVRFKRGMRAIDVVDYKE